MSKIHILDHTGDSVLTWTAEDEAAVAEARTMFDTHRAGGGAMIRTQPGPEEVVREFDPTAQEYMGVPQIQGG